MIIWHANEINLTSSRGPDAFDPSSNRHRPHWLASLREYLTIKWANVSNLSTRSKVKFERQLWHSSWYLSWVKYDIIWLGSHGLIWIFHMLLYSWKCGYMGITQKYKFTYRIFSEINVLASHKRPANRSRNSQTRSSRHCFSNRVPKRAASELCR